MNELVGSCILGQSGGPTAVINSSVYGIILTAFKARSITRVLGAKNGITGVINGELYDVEAEDPAELALLVSTPSSVFGTCRYKLKEFEEDETEYIKILDTFKKFDVRYFFYIGGNDSMDTCHKISMYLDEHNYPCRVIGVPKTIDNDLWFTDHCPGFGSAARYIALTCMELAADARVYEIKQVTIVEIMGRNAGWLTAASAIASETGLGPDLIYLPERPFDFDEFYEDVKEVLDEHNYCFVAVSEGLVDNEGNLIAKLGAKGAHQKDSFGNAMLGGVNHVLANFVRSRFKVKVRNIDLSAMQRCAAHLASLTDADEAFRIGVDAVESALKGMTGCMAALERVSVNPYRCNVNYIDLNEVANKEQKVPDMWINTRGNGLTSGFIDYCRPLIMGDRPITMVNGLPRFAKLKKIIAKP